MTFYVEMFGFPFSLYILASVFDFNILGISDPRPLAVLFGSGLAQASSQVLILIGVTMVASGWLAVHSSRGKIITTSLYSITKHPQYLGLMVIATGLLLNFPTIPTLIMYPILAVVYTREAKREENELKLSNQDYINWERKIAKPSKIGSLMIFSYIGFVGSIYFNGPPIYGIGVYQIVSLSIILVLTAVYLLRVRKTTIVQS